ncbi:MAG: serine/threonine-protein kinase [Gammaproteobacteria bacterium]|nr:serine/threonine-protein kinase [Gammaproteobacteria bacterium]MDH3388084.1 serine/threonine-protein kinase [Gammaproteobacteria bacterium]
MSEKSQRPTKIAKYEIKRRIGRGAMGVVYEAFDPFVQRTVAIKVAHSASDMDPATEQKLREGFFAEVYSAGRMHHPSVVSVYDAGQEGDLNYIVMEFVDGVTLQDYVTGGKTLTPNQVVDVIYQCAKGLDYVHREGIIHRDLKPGNIMLSNDGEVKIMDFSIAHVDVGFEGHDTEIQGSPMYMPPEQLSEEKRLVAQSDIYSLGAVMYALLARRTPYKASSLESLIYKISNLEPDPIMEINPEVPQHITDIVEKAMQKIIYDRYESAYLLATDLSNAFGRLRGIGERIDMQEKWKTLRYLAFFKDFSDEQITEVVNASEWKEYEKGTVIVTEGEQETAFYIIAKGGVEVVKNDKVVGLMKQGDCFGEIAFLTRQPRNATIVARTDVSLMSVSTSLMEQASTETQLRYYRIFLENLISRLSQATDKLVEAEIVITDP